MTQLTALVALLHSYF